MNADQNSSAPNHDRRPLAPVALLQARARLVERARHFFRDRQVLEVDPPILQTGANLDYGVVPFRVAHEHTSYFLPTSPEHALKRLLVAGIGDCWSLTPAFRAGEYGSRHRPEFRMVEWYRLSWNDQQLANETVQFCAAITDRQPHAETLSWRQAFITYAQLDPRTATMTELTAKLGADASAVGDDHAAALDLILTRDVEPHLGQNGFTILTDYPASGCAQAQIKRDQEGHPVAARFEVYADGIELANGYHECINASELRERHLRELHSRTHGEQLDDAFLAAMELGLPACAGVAVGFDRLVMLALNLPDLDATQALPWR